jgi:hypothetical protein
LGTFVGQMDKAADTFVDHQRIMLATSAAYKQMSSDWVRFAEQVSAATGFSSDAVLEAALSARTLSANYGLSIEQTRKLITVSADLARIRGIDLFAAFERVGAAIRGEGENAEFLGLTLQSTFMKNSAFNGALRETYETLDDASKAQLVYTELLRQTADFSGLAEAAAGTLGDAQNRLNTESEKFSRTLGELLAPELIGITEKYIELVKWATRFAQTLIWLREGKIELGPEGPIWDPDLVKNVEKTAAAEKNTAKTLEEILAGAKKTTTEVATTAKEVEKVRTEFEKLGDEIDDIGKKMSELGRIRDMLPGSDIDTKAALSAQENLLRIDQIITARLAAAERLRELQDNARMRTQIFDPRDVPGAQAALAQVAIYDQLEAANRDLLIAEERKVELQREGCDSTCCRPRRAWPNCSATSPNSRRGLDWRRCRLPKRWKICATCSSARN